LDIHICKEISNQHHSWRVLKFKSPGMSYDIKQKAKDQEKRFQSSCIAEMIASVISPVEAAPLDRTSELPVNFIMS
jgi:hypothetical protein